MKSITAKLISRKFWVAVSQIVAGILILCNFSETTAGLIAGCVVSCSSALIYLAVEGKIDTANAQKAAINIIDAIDSMSDADLSKFRTIIQNFFESMDVGNLSSDETGDETQNPDAIKEEA
jgi:hypothetical protein